MAKKLKEEPKIVVRPIGRLGGLDGIHVALILLVAILAALLLVVSNSQPITNSTGSLNCTFGSVNGTCAPMHNLSSVKMRVGQILASYAFVNGSLSVLPYFSSMQNLSAEYIPQSKEWFASVPATNPLTGERFYTSFLLYDSNLTLVRPYIQTVSTSKVVSNYVVSAGVVQLSGKVACLQQKPLQQYWFIDPYAPGSIASLNNLTSIQQRFGGGLNATIKIVSGSATLAIAQKQNVNNTQALGKYIFCAAPQSNFTRFVANLQSFFSNTYIAPSFLAQLANQSRLNLTSLNSCIATSTPTLNAQVILAQYYNITATPSVVTDCTYQSIPQTASKAVCYANSTLC
ncbi:MAG: hypothetical protein KGH65_05000 [Candidatus Micrarchaeota archaeon]|nr:hypothetical protein [Candidatus Micrarchaeota archaeon]